MDDGDFAPGSAQRMIETASAFARREMLPEAQQALQRARSALAERSDVGPAHWCNACLVALEIAARGGDLRAMEVEAAQLHTLSAGGQYWAEQGRARIGGSAVRVNPARLDRVFAVLAGNALPASLDSDALPPPLARAERCDPIASTPSLRAPEPPLDTAPVESNPVSPPEPLLHDVPDAGGPPLQAPLASIPDASVAPHVEFADEASTAPHVSPEPETSVAPTLATEVRTFERVPAVLPAWHVATDKPGAPPRLTPTVPAALPAAPLVVAERALAGRSTSPPAAERAAQCGMAPSSLVLPVERPVPRREQAELLPPLEPRRGEAVLRGILVFALVACAAWMYMPAATKQFLAVPGFALFRVEGEEAPGGHLARGQALLAAGDTAGAVAAFATAAQGDSRGTIAWAAAEALARLPGRATSAADAYLLAFAAGLPPDRAEIVAHAQEVAGHPDRAHRVREQAAR